MPHRLPTSGRFRISNDVLILILETFDPPTLYLTCKVFDRVRYLVMQFQHLRYMFELALAGMSDGTLSVSKRTPMMRLQVLLAYKKDWPRLNWTNEQKVQIPALVSLHDLSGDFIFYVANQSIDLLELPSCRLNRPPSQTRHMRFNTTPQADSVAIDALQSLVVAGHAYGGAAGQIGIRLKIRNLWTFDKHPHAPSPYYDCLTQVTQPIRKMSMIICGPRIVVLLEFMEGMAKQLLLDWHSYQAMWMEEHDVHFLNANYLLGAKVYRGKPVIHLYNITNLNQVTIEREYELPRHWATAELSFSRNAATTVDAPIPSRALFLSDPYVRVLLLTAKQAGEVNGLAQWLFVNEAHFRPTNRPDRRFVPWTQWNQVCLMKNVPSFPVIRNPRVIGNRVVYLESDNVAGGRGHNTRLGLIDFPAHPDIRTPSKGSWLHVGQQTALIPSEYTKELTNDITTGMGVESMGVTEDNIVLFLEPRHGMKEVCLLTFGVPSPRGHA